MLDKWRKKEISLQIVEDEFLLGMSDKEESAIEDILCL